MHTPEWLWLSTGIRAVDHCVEGICSNEAHPYGDAQALKGLSMLAEALPRVKADPAISTRGWIARSAPGCRGPAGLRRADGRQPWHRLCARRRVRRAARLHLLRDAAGGDALEQVGECRAAGAGRSRDGSPGEDAGDVLDQFIRGLGMPRSLRDVEVGPEHFDRIAEAAMGTPWVPRNPRQIEGPGTGPRDSLSAA